MGCGVADPESARVRKTIRGGLRGLLLFVLALGWTPGLQAQMDGADDVPTGSEYRAFFGALQPLANLTSNPDTWGTVISPDIALGVDATFWLSRNLGISTVGVFAPANLDVFATQAPGAVELPEDVGNATYFSGTVSLTYRIVSGGSAGSLEPYFSIGGGVRHLELDAVAEPEAESSTDPAATLAGGLRIEVLDGLWMSIELRDIVSRYESPATGDARLQNDTVLSLGFGIR